MPVFIYNLLIFGILALSSYLNENIYLQLISKYSLFSFPVFFSLPEGFYEVCTPPLNILPHSLFEIF